MNHVPPVQEPDLRHARCKPRLLAQARPARRGCLASLCELGAETRPHVTASQPAAGRVASKCSTRRQPHVNLWMLAIGSYLHHLFIPRAWNVVATTRRHSILTSDPGNRSYYCHTFRAMACLLWSAARSLLTGRASKPNPVAGPSEEPSVSP